LKLCDHKSCFLAKTDDFPWPKSSKRLLRTRHTTKADQGHDTRWRKHHRAIEPVIDHLEVEHRMRRNHLKGQLGDVLNVVLAAAGYNLRWLMRWLISFCARFRGGPVRISLLLVLIELLLGLSAGQSRLPFRPAS